MTDNEARVHKHPSNEHATIYGIMLDGDEVLLPGDQYPALSGLWSECYTDGFGNGYKAKDLRNFGPVIRPVNMEVS